MPAFLIIWHLQREIIYNNNNKELDLYSVNYIKRRTQSAEKTTTRLCIATSSDKTFSIKHFFCGLPSPLASRWCTISDGETALLSRKVASTWRRRRVLIEIVCTHCIVIRIVCARINRAVEDLPLVLANADNWQKRIVCELFGVVTTSVDVTSREILLREPN